MWIAIYVVGSLVGLVVLLNLVGLALPREHLASRRADLAQPPDRVWDAMIALSDHVAVRDNLPIAVEPAQPSARVLR